MVTEYFNKNKIVSYYLMLGVFVLLSLLFSIKLLKVKEEILIKKQDLAFERRELQLLDQIMADKDSQNLQIEKALATLPQTYQEVGALAYKLENIARENGLTTELSFDKEAKKEGEVSGLNISIKTEGSYQNYLKFISSLSNLPYNTEVTGIKAENKNGVSAETIVKVYVRK